MTAPVPLVFVAIKTTSQLPSRRAWEVAMVRREPDCTERELSMFVEDLDLAHADLAVLGSSGFYARHPRYRPGGPLESHGGGGFHPHPYLWQSHKVATKVEEWTRGAYLVGAAVSLHAEVLANMLRNYRLAPAWQFRTVDIEALAVGALASGYDVAGPLALAPPWPPIDTLSGLLSVRVPRDGERGTALGDARWAVRIYDAVMGSAGVPVEADTLTEVAEANGARAAERGEFAWP